MITINQTKTFYNIKGEYITKDYLSALENSVIEFYKRFQFTREVIIHNKRYLQNNEEVPFENIDKDILTTIVFNIKLTIHFESQYVIPFKPFFKTVFENVNADSLSYFNDFDEDVDDFKCDINGIEFYVTVTVKKEANVQIEDVEEETWFQNALNIAFIKHIGIDVDELSEILRQTTYWFYYEYDKSNYTLYIINENERTEDMMELYI